MGSVFSAGWSTINIFWQAYQRGKLVLVEETREERAKGMRDDGMRNKDIEEQDETA